MENNLAIYTFTFQVIYKTLNPKWNQALEFPDTSSPLTLHVKDHNAVLLTSSIGHCTVEYEGLLPNQTADKWIPLQGVKKGEIHVKITRKTPEAQNKSSSDTSPFGKAHNISTQVNFLIVFVSFSNLSFLTGYDWTPLHKL